MLCRMKVCAYEIITTKLAIVINRSACTYCKIIMTLFDAVKISEVKCCLYKQKSMNNEMVKLKSYLSKQSHTKNVY